MWNVLEHSSLILDLCINDYAVWWMIRCKIPRTIINSERMTQRYNTGVLKSVQNSCVPDLCAMMHGVRS